MININIMKLYKSLDSIGVKKTLVNMSYRWFDQNGWILFSLFTSAQLFERMLRCDRVYEKNKQRLRLREAGYAGLSLLFSELHITPTLTRCLLNQVLHTGLLLFF